MTTADQDHDLPDSDAAPRRDGLGKGEVSDKGGDSDPAAAASSEPTGEDQAARNRDEESPA